MARRPFLPLSILLAATVLGAASAQEPTPVKLLDEFVTGAFLGPPEGFQTPERFAEVAEANIKLIVVASGDHKLALDLAQQAGVLVVPWDARIAPLVFQPDVPVDPAIINALVADYAHHPAMGAYVVRDEPSAAMFPQLARVAAALREADPRHEPIINLFPSYASPEQLGTATYREHVRQFIDTVKPGVLCYDNYPLLVGNRDRLEPFYADLALAREESRRAGIPFWTFIQSEGIRDYLRVPNAEEVAWQANAAIAHGARGILWFCYWTPPAAPVGESTFVEHHHDAMITPEGERTPVYDFVRDTNAFALEVGGLLTGWDNTAVLRKTSDVVFGEDTPRATVDAPGSQLLMGTFEKDGAARLFVANDSPHAPTRARLGPGPFKVLAARGGWLEGTEVSFGPGGALLLEVAR